MPKNLVIDGIKYELVPVQPKEEKKSILDGYVAEEPPKVLGEPIQKPPEITGEVKKAIPKVSDYRERFKKRQVLASEVMTLPKFGRNLPKQDTELDNFTYRGEKMFFGDGISEDW